jgi:hypothetical protein
MVSHHPTIKLIGRRPLPRRVRRPFLMPSSRRHHVCGITRGFPRLSPTSGQVAHVLRTRPPRKPPESGPARLACIRHAASVDPEPGSNSPPLKPLRRAAATPRKAPSPRRARIASDAFLCVGGRTNIHSAGLLCCARRHQKDPYLIDEICVPELPLAPSSAHDANANSEGCPSDSSSRPLCQLVKLRPGRHHAPIRRGQDSRPKSASVLGRPFASGVAPFPEPAEPTSPHTPCQGKNVVG